MGGQREDVAADDLTWIEVNAERVLYVDRGHITLLCDRLPSPVTLVIGLRHRPPTQDAHALKDDSQ